MLQVNQLIGFGAGGSNNIQFVGGAITTKAQAASGDSTMSLNSGLTGGIASAAANGDFVIAAFSAGASADLTLSITDGTNPYTLIGSELYADDTHDTNLRVAYKFITADTTVTFGPSTGASGATAVYVFRGVNPSSPLDVAAQTATGTSSSLANPPSITPVTAGAFVIAVGAAAGSTEDVCPVPSFASSDLTDFLTSAANSFGDYRESALGIGHKPDWVSGAFDPAAFTAVGEPSNWAHSWAALTLALRPA